MKYRILPRELEITGSNINGFYPLSSPNWAIVAGCADISADQMDQIGEKQVDPVVPVKVTNRAKGQAFFRLACNVVAKVFVKG